MPRSLVRTRPNKGNPPRSALYKGGSTKRSQRLDAATLASNLQLQEQKRDLLYSSIALLMKIALVSLGLVSFIKLGLAFHKRVDQHSELSSVLAIEAVKLIKLQKRFDSLFTLGGGRRLLEENDQLIAPNRVRVIWR